MEDGQLQATRWKHYWSIWYLVCLGSLGWGGGALVARAAEGGRGGAALGVQVRLPHPTFI